MPFFRKRKPVDDGRFHPDFVVGETLEGDGKYVAAASSYRKAAEEGSAAAQHNLGVMCLEGRGVKADAAEAAEWFRRAAEQGLADSQANLGMCYAQGVGLPADSSEAVKWFRKAADQGLPDGQFKLGVMYANGDGVRQDLDKAYELISLAASKGHEEATLAREEVAKRAAFARMRGGW